MKGMPYRAVVEMCVFLTPEVVTSTALAIFRSTAEQVAGEREIRGPIMGLITMRNVMVWSLWWC
jgi:hypothetical protein